MSFGKRFGLAAAWMLLIVALLTVWDRFALHEAFSPVKLVLRVVMFLLAAVALSLLLGRRQDRRR